MLLNRKAPETVAVLHRSADRTSTGDVRLGQTSDGSLNSSPIHPTRFRSLQFELRAAMTVLLPSRRPLTYPQDATFQKRSRSSYACGIPPFSVRHKRAPESTADIERSEQKQPAKGSPSPGAGISKL